MAGSLAKHSAGADIVDRIMNPALRRAIPSDLIGTFADAIATGLNHVYWITLGLGFAVMATAYLLPPRLSPHLDAGRT